MLCEAAWVVVRYPSPLRAFGERIKARRGAGIATVAVAPKLVVLFWRLLTTEQDYAFGRPSLTRTKLRQLELAAGAARGKGEPGVWADNKALRQAELELARQAENRLPPPRQRLAAQKGRGRNSGTRIFKAVKRQAARQGIGPRPCA
jgi:transposase